MREGQALCFEENRGKGRDKFGEGWEVGGFAFGQGRSFSDNNPCQANPPLLSCSHHLSNLYPKFPQFAQPLHLFQKPLPKPKHLIVLPELMAPEKIDDFVDGIFLKIVLKLYPMEELRGWKDVMGEGCGVVNEGQDRGG